MINIYTMNKKDIFNYDIKDHSIPSELLSKISFVECINLLEMGLTIEDIKLLEEVL